MLLPGTSVAQEAATDPEAGSPAGTIYELPLDDARNDAAPKRPAPQQSGRPQSGGSQNGGNQDSTRPSSAIRSENGFGSSTSVPGADDSTGGGLNGTSGGSGSAGADSGSRSGGSTPAAGDAARSSGAAQATTSSADVDSGPSGLMTYGLLALVIAAGIAGGLVTRMRRRTAG